VVLVLVSASMVLLWEQAWELQSGSRLMLVLV